MFRKVKKKPTITAPKRSIVDEEEDNDGMNPGSANMDPSSVDTTGSLLHVLKKQRRNPKGLLASGGGTTAAAGGAVTRTTVRSIPKRPRSDQNNSMGMGYGGGGGDMETTTGDSSATPPPINDTFRDTSQLYSDTGGTTGSTTSHRYDSNSLSQLRQEQSFLPSNTTTTTGDTGTSSSWTGTTSNRHPTDDGSNENSVSKNVKPPPRNDYHHYSTNRVLEEEAVAEEDDVFGLGRNFIPIDENPDTIRDTVLAGDEAFAYHSGSRTDNPNMASSSTTTTGRTMDSVLGGMG
jgi:hypothetical protein